MKVLELFAGTRSIGKAFEAKGHEVYSVEWDKRFDNIDLYEDILKVTADDIIKRFGRPDVIWASPDCSSYSIAAIGHHRERERRQSRAKVGLCKVLRQGQSACSVPHPRAVSEILVHRKPARRYAKDELHERASALHRNVLPVWRFPHETDRHLDEPPRPAVQAAMSQRRPLSRSIATRFAERDHKAQKQYGALADTAAAL